MAVEGRKRGRVWAGRNQLTEYSLDTRGTVGGAAVKIQSV